MEEPSDQVCEKCGRGMVIKWGRFGKFLACSGYPDCKSTKELSGNGGGGPEAGGNGEGAAEGQACENCGKPMVLKRGRFGPFLACSGYPECRTVVKVAKAAAAPPEPTDLTCETCGARSEHLVKCINWSGAWAFAVRVGDPDGKLKFARSPE